jgi:hypothetical protein
MEGATTNSRSQAIGDRNGGCSKKQCRLCQETKLMSQFYFRKDSQSHRSECKDCLIVQHRERTLGISEEEYQVLYRCQGKKCAVCEKKLASKRYTRLAVDHCHKTGKLRGLLCTNCNTALGLFYDSPKILRKALEYLNKDIV